MMGDRLLDGKYRRFGCAVCDSNICLSSFATKDLELKAINPKIRSSAD
jgi:hypothetical protein